MNRVSLAHEAAKVPRIDSRANDEIMFMYERDAVHLTTLRQYLNLIKVYVYVRVIEIS